MCVLLEGWGLKSGCKRACRLIIIYVHSWIVFRGDNMLFVTLAKMRGSIDPEFSKKTEEFMANPPMGIKIQSSSYFGTIRHFSIV